MNRCCVCNNLKFAIASQVLIHKSSRYPYRRFICKDCGKRKGLSPTPEYLQNFREMDQELKAEDVKRQMYGRADLNLLNKRLVLKS